MTELKKKVRTQELTESELLDYAKVIFNRYFGIEFTGTIRWTRQLRVAAGNCSNKGLIKLSEQYYERYGKTEILRTLRHELCHAYCFIRIGNHREDNSFFQSLLELVDADKTAKRMPMKRHKYICTTCGEHILKKTKSYEGHYCASCYKTRNTLSPIVYEGVYTVEVDGKLNKINE